MAINPLLLQMLSGRKRNSILAPQEEEQEAQAFESPTIPPGEIDEEAEIEKLFEEGPARMDYRKHVQNMPKREDHQPSGWGRLAAALAGGITGWQTKNPLAAYKTSREIVDDKYNRALQDWQTSGKGLGEVADLEREGNQDKIKTHDLKSRVKDRRIDNDRMKSAEESRHEEAMARAKTAQERQAEQTRHNKEMERFSGMSASASMKRANAYADKTKRTPASKPKYISPQAQEKANKMALDEMEQKRSDLKFERDEKGRVTGVKKVVAGRFFGQNEEELAPEELKALDKELEKIENQILSKTYKTGTPDDVEDDDEVGDLE